MKLLGEIGQPPCGSHCCGDRSKEAVRRNRRREAQALRESAWREVDSLYFGVGILTGLRAELDDLGGFDEGVGAGAE